MAQQLKLDVASAADPAHLRQQPAAGVGRQRFGNRFGTHPRQVADFKIKATGLRNDVQRGAALNGAHLQGAERRRKAAVQLPGQTLAQPIQAVDQPGRVADGVHPCGA